jgi:hypothetical protein
MPTIIYGRYTFAKKRIYWKIISISHALAHVSVLQIDFLVGNPGVWITHISIMLETNGWNTDLNPSSRLCAPPQKKNKQNYNCNIIDTCIYLLKTLRRLQVAVLWHKQMHIWISSLHWERLYPASNFQGTFVSSFIFY